MGLELGLLASLAGAGAGVLGVVNAASARSDSKKANRESQARADATMKSQTEATNKANQKRPDSQAIIDSVMQAGRAGASGTMLTGSQGIDPNALALGKTTALGA